MQSSILLAMMSLEYVFLFQTFPLLHIPGSVGMGDRNAKFPDSTAKSDFPVISGSHKAEKVKAKPDNMQVELHFIHSQCFLFQNVWFGSYCLLSNFYLPPLPRLIGPRRWMRCRARRPSLWRSMPRRMSSGPSPPGTQSQLPNKDRYPDSRKLS